MGAGTCIARVRAFQVMFLAVMCVLTGVFVSVLPDRAVALDLWYKRKMSRGRLLGDPVQSRRETRWISVMFLIFGTGLLVASTADAGKGVRPAMIGPGLAAAGLAFVSDRSKFLRGLVVVLGVATLVLAFIALAQ